MPTPSLFGRTIEWSAILTTLAILGFFLHAATAGRSKVRVRYEHEGQVREAVVRRDTLAQVPGGVIVHPDGQRPVIASSVETVSP